MIFRGRVRQLPNVSDVSKSWYLQITTLARKTTLFLGGRGSMEGNNPNSKKIHQKMATKTRGVRSWESNNLTLVVFLKLLWPQWHLCPLSFVTWYPVPNREKSYPPYHDFQRMAALGRLTEMEKPRYNFHVPPRYLRHVSPGHLGFHKVFGHSWREPVTWLRSKMCLFFKIKG